MHFWIHFESAFSSHWCNPVLLILCSLWSWKINVKRFWEQRRIIALFTLWWNKWFLKHVLLCIARYFCETERSWQCRIICVIESIQDFWKALYLVTIEKANLIGPHWNDWRNHLGGHCEIISLLFCSTQYEQVNVIKWMNVLWRVNAPHLLSNWAQWSVMCITDKPPNELVLIS